MGGGISVLTVGGSPHLSPCVKACPITAHPTVQQNVFSNFPACLNLCAADGSISYGEGPRSIPANESLFTGAWHMVTVTSQPGTRGAVKGYRLYLDGRLVNQLSDGTSYYTPGGLSIPVRREAGGLGWGGVGREGGAGAAGGRGRRAAGRLDRTKVCALGFCASYTLWFGMLISGIASPFPLSTKSTALRADIPLRRPCLPCRNPALPSRWMAATPSCWTATRCSAPAQTTPPAATTTAAWPTFRCLTRPWLRARSGARWCLILQGSLQAAHLLTACQMGAMRGHGVSLVPALHIPGVPFLPLPRLQGP